MGLFLVLFLVVRGLLWGEDSFPEDPALFHHVNVISGSLNLCFEDGVVKGAGQLPIVRTYSSDGALERTKERSDLFLRGLRGGFLIQGGWSLFPHANLLVEPSLKTKDYKASVAEKSGQMIRYVYSHKEGQYLLYLKPDVKGGACAGLLGGRRNPRNNLLQLNLKTGEAKVLLPDGGERLYVGFKIAKLKGEELQPLYFRLMKESLPSGHRIVYGYDKKDRMVEVAFKNPSETKVFSWIRLELLEASAPYRFVLTTSDGKRLEYGSVEFKDRSYLSTLESSCRASEKVHYVEGRRGIGARLGALERGGRMEVEVSYVMPPDKKAEEEWAKKPHKVGFAVDRVNRLKGPMGMLGEFRYGQEWTEVRDGMGVVTRYRHDGERLKEIEYCDEAGAVASSVRYVWQGENLRAKVMIDGRGKPVFSKTFTYDAVGNVVEEVFWGNLTGAATGDFVLEGDGSIRGAESSWKRYAYLPHFNVKTVEEEEGGLKYRYVYKPGSDLLVAKYTCAEGRIVVREFYLYDADHLLIGEIVDNGSGENRDDLTAVTERRVRRMQLDGGTGLPVEVTEGDGARVERRTVLNYSEQRDVVSEAVYDADGVHRYTLEKRYDAHGHLIRESSPTGEEQWWKYDALGNLVSEKRVGEAEKGYTYDVGLRRVVSREGERLTRMVYDAKGRLLEEIDFRGGVTRQGHDAFGRSARTAFPDGAEVLFAYDAQGNIVSTRGALGEVSETRYNALRKPVAVMRPDGSVLKHRYNKGGSLVETTFPDGTRECYDYDLFQRMVKKEVIAAEGEVLSSESWEHDAFHVISATDERGLCTRFRYDLSGKRIEEEAEGRAKRFEYDKLGFLEKTTEGDVILVEKHDASGRVVKQWKEGSDGRHEQEVSFAYDGEGRKVKAVTVTEGGEAIDEFAYDLYGHLVRHTDPEGAVTTFSDDGVCRTTTDPLGISTIEHLDLNNRIVSTEKKNLEGVTISKQVFTYDLSGNRTKREAVVFQGNDALKNHTTEWVYDQMGRVLEVLEGGIKQRKFVYDCHGRVIEEVLPSGVVLFTKYDGSERLLERISSDDTVHDRFAYDIGPDATILEDVKRGKTWLRVTNRFGEVIEEVSPDGARLSWEYDDMGRCVQMVLPDQSTIAYTYTGGHLRTVERKRADGTPLYRHGYTHFDVNGHVAEEEVANGLGKISTVHDLLERPIKSTSPWIEQAVAYGPSGLVMETKNSLLRNKVYSYDALGQLIQAGDKTYQFDSLGNPIDGKIDACNHLLSTPDHSLTYDACGNTLTKNDSTYAYDALGRLTSLTTSEGKAIHFTYDPLSRLYSEHNGEATAFFLHNGESEIGKVDKSGKILELKVVGLGILGDIGGAIAFEMGNEWYIPLHDFNGHVQAIVSSIGDVVETYPLDPFGKEPPLPSSLKNPWRFFSKRTLYGLVHFGKRFYDPEIGRWLTPDPAGFVDGPNLYLFVLNTPLNRLDRFGLFAEEPYKVKFEMNVPLFQLHFPELTPLFKIKGMLDGVPVDLFLSCGFLNQIQFTPEEYATGTVNIVNHFFELTPQNGHIIGFVLYGNGINTPKNELGTMHQSIFDKIPEGTFTVSLHNPTEGLQRNIARTFQERNHIETKSVVDKRQFLVAVSERLNKINPQMIILAISHSENSVITKRSIEGMTPEQRNKLTEQLYFVGLGGAEPVPKEYALFATNIYSKCDHVSNRFGKPFKNDPNYDIKFVRCKSTWSQRSFYIADHAFLGNTYQLAMEKRISKLRTKFGFYNGQNR